MVGPLNIPGVGSRGDETIASDQTDKGGIAGFLSTTTGKLIAGALALALILAAVGVIAYVFLFPAGTESNLVVPQTSGSKTASGTAGVPVQREDPKPSDVFTFRNIFKPTVRPSVVTSASASETGTGTTSYGEKIPADTLYLKSVSLVDGKEVATFLWNDQTFVVGEGETLGDTPWKVLSISGASVEMLYGDSRVTLVVGQGVGK